jgi:RNA recognition motif-containing protein
MPVPSHSKMPAADEAHCDVHQIPWEESLNPPPDYDKDAPLVRICSADPPEQFEWINTLLEDSPSPSPQTISPEIPACSVIEDRGVEISNFDRSTITKEIVNSIAQRYGEIDRIDMSGKMIGRIIVKFYDLRSAYTMIQALIRISNFTWNLQFAHPEKIADPTKPPNNGCLIISHIPLDIPNERLQEHFSAFGEIREIRKTPKSHFVEFWDLRSCEKAIVATRGTKLFGLKVFVEYSRPGGVRKNPDAFLPYRKPVVARPIKKSPPIVPRDL